MKKDLFTDLNGNTNTVIEDIENPRTSDVAVIGVALKAPGAENVEMFFNNIKNKLNMISEFPVDRKRDADAYLRSKGKGITNYECGGYLKEIDKFDYEFFGLSPKEASLTDPNQRVFLQTVCEAIEDAGYSFLGLKGSKTGIYVGFNSNQINTYGQMVYDLDPQDISIAVPGNITPIIAGRVSHFLDFKGPSVVLDTACSSSLVSVHLACQALKVKDCDLAIAGGVRINLLPAESPIKIGIESKNKIIKSFDADSDGVVWGEGVAALVLKPLSAALKDKDSIYAVIKSSAVNQDGNSIGITAPSMMAQENLILEALEKANIHPETISYIEAHGTGTQLGDPIEIGAIQKAFLKYTPKKQFCALGALKTNIGHLDSMAGIAGLIKCVLSLKNKTLLPSINFKIPNKKIRFEESPIYFNDRTRFWESNPSYPRRCCVSAFGLSGTNAHVVLEEAPSVVKKDKSLKSYIFTISAKNRNSFFELIDKYKKFLSDTNVCFSDLCFTNCVGRDHYQYRTAVIADSLNGLRCALDDLSEKDVYISENLESDGKFSEEANRLIKAISDFPETRNVSLKKLIDLYVKGANIDWNYFFSSERCNRIHLPTYPFLRERCWLSFPDSKVGKDFYKMAWTPLKISENNSPYNLKTVLIFSNDESYLVKMKSILNQKCQKIIEISEADKFEKISETKYTISQTEEAYLKLINCVKSEDLSTIFHLFTAEQNGLINSLNDLKNTQKTGVYSLLWLTKALSESKFLGNLKIFLISQCSCKVSGNERTIYPEKSTLFALGKVVNAEYSNLKCKCVDLEGIEDIKFLSREFNDLSNIYQVAYRDGKRYVEQFEKLKFRNSLNSNPVIADNNVYVIFGGTGGLGLEVAKYISCVAKSKIILVSKTYKIYDEDAVSNEKDKHKVRLINEIRKSGSEVEIYNVDISDFERLSDLYENIILKYTKVNGVFHCAGVPGKGYITNKRIEDFDRTIAPKVYGTWNIGNIFKNIDFMVLFSSVNSIFGMPGQSDYTSGNVYQDNYCDLQNLKCRKTICINWAPWAETGMAVNFKQEDNKMFKALNTREAIAFMDTLLNSDTEKAIVGRIHRAKVTKKLVDSLPFLISGDIIHNFKNINEQEINIDWTYEDIEDFVAKTWKSTLGLSNISKTSNFFEIGGNSIMVSVMANIFEKKFKDIFGLSDLFSYPTISDFSKYVYSKLCDVSEAESGRSSNSKTVSDDEIDKLFEDLSAGTLSVERASEILDLEKM